jgi:hypothetical protein
MIKQSKKNWEMCSAEKQNNLILHNNLGITVTLQGAFISDTEHLICWSPTFIRPKKTITVPLSSDCRKVDVTLALGMKIYKQTVDPNTRYVLSDLCSERQLIIMN